MFVVINERFAVKLLWMENMRGEIHESMIHLKICFRRVFSSFFP